jgi:hypothetical protein
MGSAGGFVITAGAEAEPHAVMPTSRPWSCQPQAAQTDLGLAIARAAGAETVEQVPRCPGRFGDRVPREYARER